MSTGSSLGATVSMSLGAQASQGGAGSERRPHPRGQIDLAVHQERAPDPQDRARCQVLGLDRRAEEVRAISAAEIFHSHGLVAADLELGVLAAGLGVVEHEAPEPRLAPDDQAFSEGDELDV
jgi:hypothetical protein